MTYRVQVSELGIADDNTVFEGETPADVLEQLAPHLKKVHGIKLPDARDILSGGTGAILPSVANAGLPVDRGFVVPSGVEGGATSDDAETGRQVLLARLIEKLNLQGSGLEAGSDTNPRR